MDAPTRTATQHTSARQVVDRQFRLCYTPTEVEGQVEFAIEILRRGGLVAYPTDTVYGLGANPLDEVAVARVYEVKGRPRHVGLPLLIGSVSQLESVASDVPDVAWLLAEHLLPGALTLVLRKSPSVPAIVSGGRETIAVRVPNHPVPIALVEGLGTPLVGTSANLSGRPSPVTAEEVRGQLGGRVDHVIDGGRCPGGVDSTVIDLTEKEPRIAREGAVSREEIQRACGLHVY